MSNQRLPPARRRWPRLKCPPICEPGCPIRREINRIRSAPTLGFLAYKKYADAGKAKALKDVLTYCLTDGQKQSESLGYIPLPEAVVKKVKAVLESIQSGGAAPAKAEDKADKKRPEARCPRRRLAMPVLAGRARIRRESDRVASGTRVG